MKQFSTGKIIAYYYLVTPVTLQTTILYYYENSNNLTLLWFNPSLELNNKDLSSYLGLNNTLLWLHIKKWRQVLTGTCLYVITVEDDEEKKKQ